jgi:acyl-CoA thioester hydrolase
LMASDRAASSGAREFVFPVTVYYEDTDAGGVVYHANYLKFMERARTEWLRRLGFDLHDLHRDHNLLFPVRQVRLEYQLPARLNERLTVRSSLVRRRRVAMYFEQTVLRDGALLCHAEVEIVCVYADSFRPRRIPDLVFEELRTNGDP